MLDHDRADPANTSRWLEIIVLKTRISVRVPRYLDALNRYDLAGFLVVVVEERELRAENSFETNETVQPVVDNHARDFRNFLQSDLNPGLVVVRVDDWQRESTASAKGQIHHEPPALKYSRQTEWQAGETSTTSRHDMQQITEH